MKALLAVALLFSGITFAEGPSDRIAIEKLIHALKTADPVSSIFTDDADSELARLQEIERDMWNASRQPGSHVAPPAFVMASLRFLSSEVALVNAAEVQLGPKPPRKIPVLLIVKKESSGWKIASLRILASRDSDSVPAPLAR
jgi:hypothetical protein